MKTEAVSRPVDLTALTISRAPVEILLPHLRLLDHDLRSLGCSFEIVVIGAGRPPVEPDQLAALGARYEAIEPFKYGVALKHGLRTARGRYVLTMDADFFGHVGTLDSLWRERKRAAIVIASRFTSGARAAMPLVRKLSARVLNLLTARLLSVPVRDLTCGYRLIRRNVFDESPLESDGFDVLAEMVVRAYAAGRQVIEVPTTYVPSGRPARRQPLAVAWALVHSAWRWWRLRNSIDSADYDERAFFSLIPLQRWGSRWTWVAGRA